MIFVLLLFDPGFVVVLDHVFCLSDLMNLTFKFINHRHFFLQFVSGVSFRLQPKIEEVVLLLIFSFNLNVLLSQST